MIRVLFLLHRYLGIAFGLLISIWCLSAFVMLYVRFPELSREEALRGLAPLNLAACCRSDAPDLARFPHVESFRIEMFAGSAVLRIDAGRGQVATVRLPDGQIVERIDPDAARMAATSHFKASRRSGPLAEGVLLQRDQWTVNGAFDRHRPLYRFRAGGPETTEVYVSGTTGEIVQQSTGRERFWNWFGAVTHWLYPTVLRRHPAAWHYTVVLTSAASLFLIAIGIYIGCRQYGARRNGRKSPYRGAALWHHYGGLVFGALCLTFLFSGLLSMNPLGLLDGDDGNAERQRLAGIRLDGGRVSAVLEALAAARLPPSTVRIESAAFAGKLALIAWQSNGGFLRLRTAPIQAEPLSSSRLTRAASILASRSPIVSAQLLDKEDRYWFGHHEEVPLPVYRVILGDVQETRYYIHPETGKLLLKIDRTGRWNRWLFQALHRGDFAALLRRRPVWDVFMLVLLSGVTVSSLTGTYMGMKRPKRREAATRA